MTDSTPQRRYPRQGEISEWAGYSNLENPHKRFQYIVLFLPVFAFLVTFLVATFEGNFWVLVASVIVMLAWLALIGLAILTSRFRLVPLQVVVILLFLQMAFLAFGLSIPFYKLEVPLRILTMLSVGVFVVAILAANLMDKPGPTLLEVTAHTKWISVAVFVALIVLAIYKGITGGGFFVEASAAFPTSDPNPFSIFDADAEIVCSPETEELRVGTTSFEIHDECWSKKYKNPKGAEKIDWSLSIRHREPDVCVDIWFPFKHGEKILDYQRGTVISCDQPMPSNHPEEFRVKSKYNPQTFSVHHKN